MRNSRSREKFKLTVVVCTHNRAPVLRGCLESLQEQTSEKPAVEVLIVDNASTDQTTGVANGYAMRNPTWRVLYEAAPGLSNARNCGWQNAQGEYVGYIDDDARTAQRWADRACEIIDEHRPDIFGGSVYPLFETKKPKWFHERYEIRCATNSARWNAATSSLAGSNLFFRREIFHRHGGFDPNLGMQAAKLGYGEETDMMERVLDARPDTKIYFDPELRVLHLTPATKMRVSFFFYSRFKAGRDYFHRLDREAPPGVRISMYRLISALGPLGDSIVPGVFKRDRAKYPYWQSYLVEEVAPQMVPIGRHFEQSRNALGRLLKKLRPMQFGSSRCRDSSKC